MGITMEDFYRKAHIYMESESGRKDVFALFREKMANGINSGNIGEAISAFIHLKGYIEGDSFLFMNYERPNIMNLRKQQKNIKREALQFFKENLDLIEQTYIKTTNSSEKFNIMYTLIKYLPEAPLSPIFHYVDLYLLMFHTVQYLDTFEGSDTDKFDLGDIILRAFGRYDCMELGERFIKDTRLEQLVKEYSLKFTPYEAYAAALKKVLQEEMDRKEKTGIFAENVLAPLLFTRNFIELFDKAFDGIIKNSLNENKDKIFSHIFSRLYGLFPESKNERDIIEYISKDYFNEQINRLNHDLDKQIDHPGVFVFTKPGTAAERAFIHRTKMSKSFLQTA